MNKPIISIVVAIGGKNRVIGKDNKLPWHIPKDLQHFKEITTGHPIIMGRKTFESIGRPLPKRVNIVITRDPAYKAPGCIVVHSLEKALDEAIKRDSDEICIIGGGQIFNQAISIADKLYITLVQGEFEGDVFFPNYSAFTKVLSRSSHKDNGYNYTYLDLVRNNNP